jgi:hypothetical protein
MIVQLDIGKLQSEKDVDARIVHAYGAIDTWLFRMSKDKKGQHWGGFLWLQPRTFARHLLVGIVLLTKRVLMHSPGIWTHKSQLPNWHCSIGYGFLCIGSVLKC